MTEFTLDESIRAQKAMRDALGLNEEVFPLPAFIGMVSDEIEQLRAAGRSDEQIAEMVHATTGKTIDPAEIARHYAEPERRNKG